MINFADKHPNFSWIQVNLLTVDSSNDHIDHHLKVHGGALLPIDSDLLPVARCAAAGRAILVRSESQINLKCQHWLSSETDGPDRRIDDLSFFDQLQQKQQHSFNSCGVTFEAHT